MANMYTVEQIREAMRDRNQTEVARRTGIHPMTINKIMNGQDSMNLSTYKKLVDYLFQNKEQYAAAALSVGSGIYNGWYAHEEDAIDCVQIMNERLPGTKWELVKRSEHPNLMYWKDFDYSLFEEFISAK